MSDNIEVSATTRSGLMARRAVAAGSAGYLIEAYDSAIYGTLIVYLTRAFFSSASETGAFLQAFATYGMTFVSRPLGSLLFGWYADRRGRREAMVVSIVLLGGTTLLIGVLPTFAQIGVVATILLVLLRLLQGVALGGETGVAPVFVVEHAATTRRGLWGGFMASAGQLGFVAAAVVTLLVSLLPPQALNTWGWRLPFLIAGPLAMVGLYLRRHTQDANLFRSAHAARNRYASMNPVREVFRRNWRQLLQLIALIAFDSPLYLLLAYFPVYLRSNPRVSESQISAVVGIVLTTLVLLYPVAGMISDRVGRRTMLIGSGISTLVLVTPAFMLAGSGGFWAVLLGAFLLVLPVPACFVVIITAQSELFATDVRATGSGIGYNTGVVLFAGLPPFMAALLVNATGSKLAPAFMIMVIVFLGLIAALTYPRQRDEVELSSIDDAELGRCGAGVAEDEQNLV